MAGRSVRPAHAGQIARLYDRRHPDPRLGIGANTAIFSVVQGAVLSPLPYRDPDRLVFVWLNNFALKHPTDLSYPDFVDWRVNSRSFEQMAAIGLQGYDLTSPGTPEHLAGRQVSSGFFKTLGVEMAFGREFTEKEDQQGGTPVAVITSRLAKDRFGDDRAAPGKSAILSGVAYTIVGVLPAGFVSETSIRIFALRSVKVMLRICTTAQIPTWNA